MYVISPEVYEKIKKWKLKDKVVYFLFYVILPIAVVCGVEYFNVPLIIDKSSTTLKNELKNDIRGIVKNEISNNVMISPGITAGTQDTKGGDSLLTSESTCAADGVLDESMWFIDEKRIEKEKDDDGVYYCVKDLYPNFDSYELWYRDKVPLGTSIIARYQLKNRNNQRPRFIFVFGAAREYRIFFPKSDGENISFESKSKKDEEIRKLGSVPVDTSKEAFLEMQINNNTKVANQINFNYTYKYFPLFSDQDRDEKNQISPETSEEGFSDRSVWINSNKMQVEQKFGFGVWNGDCIKILECKITSGS